MVPDKSHVDFLNSISSLSEATIEELKSIAKFKTIKEGTHLVKMGDIPKKIYMLVSGVLRCYLGTESGKEFNKTLYFPMCFVGPLTALIKKEPSLLSFQAITECQLYEVNYYDVIELCKTDEALNTMYSKVLEDTFMVFEQRVIEMISLDATKRYLLLKERIPDVDSLVPQYHIASFLGITPVQLSRIRKKIETD
ncbi:hypothetical protein BWZ22_15030 [Seonamhaeicola sp. S2-3]|uniref:Crp/Fnr family transcriptional regulator n=1 Tax=Seonamhaeicola sp. S2-3 TaxID=1936081 RepID=UPI000972B01A|nr:Crp/Fnr family transcriptional regulator [Seonamhaeicola sp. S2-3]APY12453.1 hypothetical protein BWZ22_15030 [Seonamhaeicola sp. S2-3]